MTMKITSLVQEGSTGWNEWRINKGKAKITFNQEKIEEKETFIKDFCFQSEIEFNFLSAEIIVFENIIFEKNVNFTNCSIASLNFKNCTFNNDLKFNQCEFQSLGLYRSSINAGLSILESTIGALDLPNIKIRTALSINKSNLYCIAFNQNHFSYKIHFESTTIDGYINCFRSIFASDVLFSNSKINGYINFRGTIFENRCCFDNVEIKGDAIFNNSKFYEKLNFFDVKFFGDATFSGSQFVTNNIPYNKEEDYYVDFSNSVFYKNAYFMSESISPNYYKTLHQKHEKQIENLKLKNLDLDKEKIASANFGGVKFYGKTSFQGRKFIAKTNFGPSTNKNIESATEFKYAPNFHECEFHQNTTFYKAVFPEATGSDEAARAYRTLKLAFQKKYDLRQEQKFYLLEIKEEAVLEGLKTRWIYWAYDIVGKYGFSIIRPIILILITQILATSFYGHSANLEFCNPTNANCNLFSVLFQFSLSGIPGFERIGFESKELLFSNGLPLYVSIMLIIHKLTTVTGIFLICLALRNLFKMK